MTLNRYDRTLSPRSVHWPRSIAGARPSRGRLPRRYCDPVDEVQTQGALIVPRLSRQVIPDAVVLVPGMMGSALSVAGELVWGFENLRWHFESFARAGFQSLKMTPAELEGDYSRVQPDGLLRAKAYLPGLRRATPYHNLVRALLKVLVSPDALLCFSYDWRLPIDVNAKRLALASNAHLDAWRSNPHLHEFRDSFPDAAAPSLAVVAHSMGGLLTQTAAPHMGGLNRVITLGTPWLGAPMAFAALSTGRGLPLPQTREKVRALLANMPGLHDLLPTYECVDEVEGFSDPRYLTEHDIRNAGGDVDLMGKAFDASRRRAKNVVPGHVNIVGIMQDTVQLLAERGHRISPAHYSLKRGHDPQVGYARDRQGLLVRVDELGDGTVPLSSSERGFNNPLSQQHDALVSAKEACQVVTHKLVHGDRALLPTSAGGFGIGLGAPDIVSVGERWQIKIFGVDDPTAVTLRIVNDLGDEVPCGDLWPRTTGDHLSAPATVELPGLYEVIVDGGGQSEVSQVVMVDG